MLARPLSAVTKTTESVMRASCRDDIEFYRAGRDAGIRKESVTEGCHRRWDLSTIKVPSRGTTLVSGPEEERLAPPPRLSGGSVRRWRFSSVDDVPRNDALGLNS